MKLATYQHPAHGHNAHAGVAQGDRILNAARLLSLPFPLGMRQLLARAGGLDALAAAANRFAAEYADTIHVPRELAVPSWEARLLPPVPDPPALRDFYAFE